MGFLGGIGKAIGGAVGGIGKVFEKALPLAGLAAAAYFGGPAIAGALGAGSAAAPAIGSGLGASGALGLGTGAAGSGVGFGAALGNALGGYAAATPEMLGAAEGLASGTVLPGGTSGLGGALGGLASFGKSALDSKYGPLLLTSGLNALTAGKPEQQRPVVGGGGVPVAPLGGPVLGGISAGGGLMAPPQVQSPAALLAWRG
jgi:hypothetical protein